MTCRDGWIITTATFVSFILYIKKKELLCSNILIPKKLRFSTHPRCCLPGSADCVAVGRIHVRFDEPNGEGTIY